MKEYSCSLDLSKRSQQERATEVRYGHRCGQVPSDRILRNDTASLDSDVREPRETTAPGRRVTTTRLLARSTDAHDGTADLLFDAETIGDAFSQSGDVRDDPYHPLAVA